ncbi:MAG: DUF2071 domain-containing protein [Planctomycetota bacterium]
MTGAPRPDFRVPTDADREAARLRPAGSPAMYQTWKRLLFLHWEVDPASLRPLIPDDLELDLWEGRAYVGVVPFAMRGIRPRGLPAVPGISNFLETNLRTYVRDRAGRPGVWFFSLDANRSLAVWCARTFFDLPYFRADMRETREDDGAIFYTTKRRDAGEEATFRYRPHGDVRTAAPGGFEFFLAERYILFALDGKRGRSRPGRVHHVPYPLRDVEVPLWDDGLFALAGLPRPAREPDHALYSDGVDVEVFALEDHCPAGDAP